MGVVFAEQSRPLLITHCTVFTFGSAAVVLLSSQVVNVQFMWATSTPSFLWVSHTVQCGSPSFDHIYCTVFTFGSSAAVVPFSSQVVNVQFLWAASTPSLLWVGHALWVTVL